MAALEGGTVLRVLVVWIAGSALALPGLAWARPLDFGRSWPGAPAEANRAWTAYRSHEAAERAQIDGHASQAEDPRAVERDEQPARAPEEAARGTSHPQTCTWVREPMTGRAFWICN